MWKTDFKLINISKARSHRGCRVTEVLFASVAYFVSYSNQNPIRTHSKLY